MQQNLYAVAGYRNGILHAFHKLFAKRAVLKALLSVIEGGYDFAYYAKTVLAFAGVSLLSEVIMCVSDYKGLVIQKDIFKAMNNMIFKKDIRGRHKLL
mgnify:CR=1 FL=1